jgi:hypothetical protein
MAAENPDPGLYDIVVDQGTALIYSAQAPLAPEPGQRDARAVWCHVPPRHNRSVLIYLHGHNGYVTVDAYGRSRVPDWAAGDATARAGAAGKEAAPLVYGLDRLESKKTGKAPIVLVPEVSTLAKGSFWAKEPTGQYADPARLGLLVADCWDHLASLKRPDISPYLRRRAHSGPVSKADLDRIYLGGHSGAGLPLEQAAVSTLVSPESGVPTDLWLFDSTYWSQVDGFVKFCEIWHRAKRLRGAQRDSARLVCLYRPQTQTEEVADQLRSQIAKVIGASPASLVLDQTPGNLEQTVKPALAKSGVLFVRTQVDHDDIPKFFIPILLETAAG